MTSRILILVYLLIGSLAFAGTYKPNDYYQLTTTSSVFSSAPAKLSGTTSDWTGVTDPSHHSDPGATGDDDDWTSPESWNEAETTRDDDSNPNSWDDPNRTPLGSPWPLLLFAAAYATYGALRLRRRKRGSV